MKDITIVLVGTKNSGNLGAVARAMANFGFSKLILVNPEVEADDEARNRAKHAQKILDGIKIMSFEDVIKKHSVSIATTGIMCSDYNIMRSPVSFEEAAKRINSIKGKTAIIFGREDDGLYNHEIEKADFAITIPSNEKYPVLNLSHAVAVVLYELSKKKNLESFEKLHSQANERDKHELMKLVNDLIKQEKFRTENEKATQQKVWKRMIGKGLLTRREAFSLMGFLKKLKK